MDEGLWSIMNIVGPVLLLVALIWLIVRRRSNRRPDRAPGDDSDTGRGTRALYEDEETRRREGTDGL